MDNIKKLVEFYGLEEDGEHVIIPYTRADGEQRKIFLLRRPCLMVRHGQFQHATVSLEEAIEAIVRNPEASLWDALGLSEQKEEAQ